LTERGFHHARHTYATLALTAGVPMHIVSSVMGHNKPSTTLDIYAQLLKGQASQSTAAFNRLFDAG
jgi:integrase